jgi:capsular polysaccharide export protein
MDLLNYPKIIGELSTRFDLAGRVDYLETGNLELLLRHTRGMVTVNSTTGTLALGLGCPTIALGDPIYNLPDLCFQGPLDAFWTATPKPDPELFRRFRNAVIHATQINGGFYCRRGIDLAVANSRRFLEAGQSPLEELL